MQSSIGQVQHCCEGRAFEESYGKSIGQKAELRCRAQDFREFSVAFGALRFRAYSCLQFYGRARFLPSHRRCKGSVGTSPHPTAFVREIVGSRKLYDLHGCGIPASQASLPKAKHGWHVQSLRFFVGESLRDSL